jgi:hypothetical protein
MTNKKFLREMLGIMLVFGFVLAGCDDGNNSKDVPNGTAWESISTEKIPEDSETSYTITGNIQFTSPDFEWKFTYNPALPADIAAAAPALMQGTYTVSGNTVTFKIIPGDIELQGTFSANELKFAGDEEEPDVVYTRKSL